MQLNFEKGPTLGYFYDDGSNLRGLWFANRSDAQNTFQIQMSISTQDVKGRKTSEADYNAATSGACPIEDGPTRFGGFVLMFPSARS